MYACLLIKILHVGKSHVANMRLALQSLGRKVIFLKNIVVCNTSFSQRRPTIQSGNCTITNYREEQYDLNREILTISVHI